MSKFRSLDRVVSVQSKHPLQSVEGKMKKPAAHRYERRKVRASLRRAWGDEEEI